MIFPLSQYSIGTKPYLLSLTAVLISILSFAQTQAFQSFQVSVGKYDGRVQAMIQESNHHIFMGTNLGVMEFNGLEFIQVPFVDSIKTASITSLAWFDETLWAGGSKGEIFKMADGELRPWKHPMLDVSSQINDLFAGEDFLGIATYGDGLYILKGDSVVHYNTERGLADDYTYDIERLGNGLWVGTDAGISQIDLTDGNAYLYSMSHGLPDNIVTSLSKTNENTLIVGMYDQGVCTMDTRTFQFDVSFSEDQPWTQGAVKCLITDQEGYTWVGTESNGLIRMRLNQENRALQAFTEEKGLPSNNIISLMIDAESNVWFGNAKGVSACLGSQFEFLTKQDGLIEEEIYDVLVDREGAIWMASKAGVMRYSYDQTGASHLDVIRPKEDRALHIVTLFEDREGYIWMGTYGNGVFVFDPHPDKLIELTEDDGLSNNNVMNITQGPKGRIWLSTLGGLTALSGSEGSYKVDLIYGSESLGHHTSTPVLSTPRDNSGSEPTEEALVYSTAISINSNPDLEAFFLSRPSTLSPKHRTERFGLPQQSLEFFAITWGPLNALETRTD